MEKMKKKKFFISQLKTKDILLFLIFILLMINSSFAFLFYKNYKPLVLTNRKKKESIQECSPYNINFASIGNSEAKISWETKEKCFSLLQYGIDKRNLSLTEVPSITNNYHYTVKLDSLQNHETYYFIIISENKEYGLDSMPINFNHDYN